MNSKILVRAPRVLVRLVAFSSVVTLGANAAVAGVPGPAAPQQFVCTIAAGYKVNSSGEIDRSSRQSSGGTITIDARSAVVAGDAINAQLWAWHTVPAADSRSGVKLVGTSNSEVAELSVLTSEPAARDGATWYPFVFLDAGRGSLISGLCRGAR